MKTVSGKSLSKIGIGTWGVGGRGHRNVEVFDVLEDQSYIDALTYTLEKGINFTEISPGFNGRIPFDYRDEVASEAYVKNLAFAPVL